jgi:two-component system response regulator DctR
LAQDALVRARAAAGRATAERLARLSARERQVLDLVVGGLLNKQIAMQLGIAERTVEDHRRRVMQTMGVSTVAELVRQVTQHVQRAG